eukprot:697450-Ditylum_brightwellii.AAC.1
MNKCYNGCAWEVKEKIMDTHRKCHCGWKSSFIKESEFRVCKIPQKRVCQMKMLKSVYIEVGDREMRRLVSERKKSPIRLSQKIKSVQ